MMVPRYWYKKIDNATYLISTDTDLADLNFITTAFASEDMSWTKPSSPENLKTMLANSCTVSLYIITLPEQENNADSPSSDPNFTPRYLLNEEQSHLQTPRKEYLQQIGMARLITDYITFAYLTDVYLHPSYRSKGLGKWLMSCTREIIDAMPELRRAMLLTNVPKEGVPYYEKALGMKKFVQNMERLVVMTTGLNG